MERNSVSSGAAIMSPLQIKERDDARRGALYFLANTQMSPNPALDFGIIKNLVGNTEILSDMKSAALALVPEAVTTSLVVPVEIMKKITDAFAAFFEAVRRKLVGIFGEALIGVEFVGEFLSWAVSALAGSLANLVPGWGYVQSASDLYSGVKKAVLQGKDFINGLWGQRGVALLEGLPQDIADALVRHAAVGVAGGLKGAGIASVSIGLEAAGDAAGGAGAFVSVVTGVLQRLANLVDWCVQKFRMRSVLSSAAHNWIDRDDADSLVNDHDAFTTWFRTALLCTPVTGALVLSAGVCAHPYRFLLLIYPDGKITSQAAFNKGVRYIDTLKQAAARYIKNYCATYRFVFTSPDAFVAARLAEVV